MALSHQHRSSLYLSLSPVVGTEEAEALLAELPSTSGDELATKDFVRAESVLTRAELRHEIDVLRTDVTHEIDVLRTDVTREIDVLRTDVTREIAGLRAELRHEIDGLRAEMRHEIDALRTEMHSMFRRQTVWMASLVIAAFSASTAVNAFVVMAAR